MTFRLPAACLLATLTMLGGCAATTPPDTTVKSTAEAKECVLTTGSRICRKPGNSSASPVVTMSGEDLRREVGSASGGAPAKP